MSLKSSDNTVAFWIDFGPLVGSGHFSRCRGLIEFLSKKGCRIECYTQGSIGKHNWFANLENSKHLTLNSKNVNELFAKERLVIDTYQTDIQARLASFQNGYAVNIVDSNGSFIFKNPKVMEIRLESSNLLIKDTNYGRRDGQKKSKISASIGGSLIWNSKLEDVARTRSLAPKAKGNQGKNILLSFGGSTLTYYALEKAIQFLDVIKERVQIKKIICFAELEVANKLNARFGNYKSIIIKTFSDAFYQELKSCDLLICASGTTAIEAFHLGVPLVAFDLFENASDNFQILETRPFLALVEDKIILENFSDFHKVISFALETLKPCSPFLEGILESNQLQLVYDHLFNLRVS